MSEPDPVIGAIREAQIWTGRTWVPYSPHLQEFLATYATELAKMNAGGVGEFRIEDVFTKREARG